jgi:hypothetical protein
MAKPTRAAWGTRVRKAAEQWRAKVDAWRKLFPRVVHQLDGRSYLALKSPEQLTPEERQAEGYTALPGWMLTSGKGLSTTSGVSDEDLIAAGYERCTTWSRSPTGPLARAAIDLAAATKSLVAVGAHHATAVDVLALQRFLGAIKLWTPSVEQLALLDDARFIAEQIELRFPAGRPVGLKPMTPAHWAIVEVVATFGDAGSVARDIREQLPRGLPAGVYVEKGKQLQRMLEHASEHGVVELIDGTKRWRTIGQT